MNYYNEIKDKLIDNEIYSRVKDYSKERHRVVTYYEIGRLLNEAGSKYGDNIIEKYSKKLTSELGKKYSTSSLKRFRQFYNLIQKGATLSHQLSWSHYIELIPLNDICIINYYVELIEKGNLSIRQIREKIKSKEYERLPKTTRNKLINKEKSTITDYIKNPILIKNNKYKNISEKLLQKLILEDIPSFLKELGTSFTFIENEYKIKIGNRYNYIDLLLYNIKYKCYVVIELKVIELKKEHIGQIQVYMNYIDNNIKTIEENKTVGIIICKKNNKYIIEYCSDNRIISKEYELV